MNRNDLQTYRPEMPTPCIEGPTHGRGEAYRKAFGPVAPGLVRDHLCHNRRCVNAEHIEAVTSAENIRRAFRLLTHCVNGHPFDEANTRVSPKGHRKCRACDRAKYAGGPGKGHYDRAAKGLTGPMAAR